MNFTKQILFEALIRYVLTFSLVAMLYNSIQIGLSTAATGGKLEAIAVVMGIVSLCSLTGYFAFSYTVVAKSFWSRLFGYLCAFGLTLPLILSWLILYFIASTWIPEMSSIWLLILLVLYIGILFFDLIDLMRMGLDIAATSFFESANTSSSSSDSLDTLLSEINNGQRLSYANGLIGSALIECSKKLNDKKLLSTGEWIIENVTCGQHTIDQKVIEGCQHLKEDNKINAILEALSKDQPQEIADSLINELLKYLTKQ